MLPFNRPEPEAKSVELTRKHRAFRALGGHLFTPLVLLTRSEEFP